MTVAGATWEGAKAALDSGAALLVYPGGDCVQVRVVGSGREVRGWAESFEIAGGWVGAGSVQIVEGALR